MDIYDSLAMKEYESELAPADENFSTLTVEKYVDVGGGKSKD